MYKYSIRYAQQNISVTTMRKEKKLIAVVAIFGLALGTTIIYLYNAQLAGRDTLTISTTTSLYDTGLLDELKESYESSQNEVILAFISAGTGIALEQASRGDADMILVHSPSQERSFMQQGYGVNRKIFAYNYFTIVGPASDPAVIDGMSTEEALQTFYEYGHTHNESLWISRDDASGTNTKEKGLWTSAGYDYEEIKSEPWFLSSGSGMGDTLLVAGEQDLYTLSDIGTFLKYQAGDLINLEQFVEEGESLINVYSAMAVNQSKVSTVNFQASMNLIQWLISDTAQAIIEGYGVDEFDSALFSPAVDILESQMPTQTHNWIRNYAFFESGGSLYECPPAWRMGDFGLY